MHWSQYVAVFCLISSLGCFAPVAVAHAHMDYNSTFYAGGSMVTYTCNPTYELVGPPSITCIQDPAKSVYVWTPGPNCLRKVYECGPLPKITNGKHSDTYNRTVNSTVAYTCDRDFKLIGQETVACVLAINQSTATWTERPSCIPDHASGLRMDGNTISRSDEQITTINITMFSIIRVSVVAGKHHIYHVDSSVSFGVIVYGFDTDELYGFPLGLGRYVPTSIKRNKGSILPTTPYHIQTQFFIDPNFQQEIPGNPLSVKTVANVFVKTFVDNVDWKVKMRLHSCYAEQTLDGFNGSYNLINNGCEMDANTHLLSQTAHETRFVFQAFHISGLDQQLYINCDATICDTSDLMSSHQCDQRPDCAKQ
ncbi:uncharacterized protein LOC127858707 isoform X3 [Dreissena polymorpha]|uniref:uncharacterized protein LOC127858707 isoform X3 n=1 Tax=Dreissena polymorpha TaxID=45954 RepID=UPI0022655DEA|nr:uncharacterized protein LOC127858707 isoform X3 [Dreissena polymorpha]